LTIAGDLVREAALDHAAGAAVSLATASKIHPIHAPEMAIEILETAAIHEVVVVLRRQIDHAAGALLEPRTGEITLGAA
jgi:hypothetical protein